MPDDRRLGRSRYHTRHILANASLIDLSPRIVLNGHGATDAGIRDISSQRAYDARALRGLGGYTLMPGRPRIYASSDEARRAANSRATRRARDNGVIQRSVALPAECWSILRASRAPGETSDAQTLARLLHSSA